MDIVNSVGILDLIFIVILAISVLLGLIRGVIREVLSLVGLGASVYLAFSFSDYLSKTYTAQFFEDPKISYIVTFVIIIVATLFCVTLINLFLSQLLKTSGLSFINRFFGAVFGVLRGALICSILVMVISFVPGVSSKSWWQASSLAPIFKQLTKVGFKYLPDEVRDYFDSAKQSVGQAANELGLPTQKTVTKSTQVPAVKAQPARPVLESIDNVDNTKPNTPQQVPKNQLILESYQDEQAPSQQ